MYTGREVVGFLYRHLEPALIRRLADYRNVGIHYAILTGPVLTAVIHAEGCDGNSIDEPLRVVVPFGKGVEVAFSAVEFQLGWAADRITLRG